METSSTDEEDWRLISTEAEGNAIRIAAVTVVVVAAAAHIMEIVRAGITGTEPPVNI